MKRLADNLSGRAGRTVVDETGLPGDYELTLEFAPDVSIFTAVREQLGLTLDASRGLLPVLIVDQVERPTPD
jgi:bla regulator protein blaR1